LQLSEVLLRETKANFGEAPAEGRTAYRVVKRGFIPPSLYLFLKGRNKSVAPP